MDAGKPFSGLLDVHFLFEEQRRDIRQKCCGSSTALALVKLHRGDENRPYGALLFKQRNSCCFDYSDHFGCSAYGNLCADAYDLETQKNYEQVFHAWSDYTYSCFDSSDLCHVVQNASSEYALGADNTICCVFSGHGNTCLYGIYE